MCRSSVAARPVSNWRRNSITRRRPCAITGWRRSTRLASGVTLIEAGPRILPALPEKLADGARKELEALGVRVLSGMPVVEVTDDGVLTQDGEFIQADLKVWAAGVKGPELLRNIGGLETNRNDQLVVLPTLQTTRDDHIFAIGDCCFCLPEEGARPIPPRAQAAHQMATTAFHNLKRMIAGKPLIPFVYKDHGSLISLSRVFNGGQPDGQSGRGPSGDRGADRADRLSFALPHASGRHPWLAQRHNHDPGRPCEPGGSPQTETALRIMTDAENAGSRPGWNADRFRAPIFAPR